MGDWSADDYANLITAGNDIALQWYIASHGGGIPGQDGIVTTMPGLRAGISSQNLVLLVLGGLALYLVLKK
jgi:hypothetical protein